MQNIIKKLGCCLLATVTFGLVSCPVMGQELPKKDLTPDDYKLWGTLRLDGMSHKGNWVAYSKGHPSGNDTLFIKNTKTDLEMAFPGIPGGQFAGEHTFGFLQKETLKLVSLRNGKIDELPNIDSFRFSGDGSWLVTLGKSENGGEQLAIYDTSGKLHFTVENIISHDWNTEKNSILFTAGHGTDFNTGLFCLGKNITVETILKSRSAAQSLTWNKTGTAVAFYAVPSGGKDGDISLYQFRLAGGRLYSLNPVQAGAEISGGHKFKLVVPDDAQSVFFEIGSAKETNKVDTANVEIWRNDDRQLAPGRKAAARLRGHALAAWWPDTGKVIQLNDTKYSWVARMGANTALIADPLVNEPGYRWYADMDFILVDTRTGQRNKILEKQSWQFGVLSIAPDGNFLTYYRGNDWWIYDRNRNTHTNVTTGLNGEWVPGNKRTDDQYRVFGNAGWTADHKWVLYYDKHDIWAISHDGKARKRLTKGMEKGLRFRFASLPGARSTSNYSVTNAPEFNTSQKVILTATSLVDGSSGYYMLDFKTGARPIVFKPAQLDGILLSGNRNAVAYVEQAFASSPAIKFKHIGKADDITVAQSNQPQKRFHWGFSKMIHYTNHKGQLCNGALFYPARFEDGKKYPMIVYIYDDVSHELHRYVNPSLENPIGFNVTNLTSKGYFVLMADIVYEEGNVGVSATDCVVSAVDKVVHMGLVDPAKVGLFGHSFGGFESSFIITNTDIFAAAVSGSCVTDIVSQYLSYSDHYSSGNAWRFEAQQYRMKQSFYDDPEAYHRNSTIENAANIKTPLLSWSGAKDINVPSGQLMELYMAMRRLGKRNIMLVYPDEGHIFTNRGNQEDLTNKLEDWFGYYLKGEPQKPWMVAAE